MWLSRPTGKLKRRWPKTLDHYILRESEADTSFESIKRLAIARFGSDVVRSVEVSDTHTDWGADTEGLKVNETLFLFKDGVYYGSKANLPMH